jgi:hypothetical protein
MGTLRASEIFNDSGLMLIAIESVDFRHSKTNTVCRIYGKIEPIAVIVCGPDAIYALDMEAKPAALDQLRQDIPELDAIIEPFNKA